MGDMALLDSRPALRWLAPAAFLLVVGGSGLAATSATAEPKLPTVTAEQLLVDLQEAQVDGLSGTVLQKADLGLPALPTSGHGESTEFRSLLNGEHRLRVWYATPGKSRVAVTGAFGETDLIRNGTDLWTWSSKTKAVTHALVPEPGEQPAGPSEADLPKTPQEAAAKVLAAIDPSTTVSVDSAVEVAGRPAYELVLRPKDNRSLLTEARVAVDGETRSPLRVQIFGKDRRTVLDVGYSDVSFTRPADSTFEFTPPPGSEVTEKTVPDHAKSRAERDEAKGADRVTTVGSGWTTVAVSQSAGDPTAAGGELQGFLDQLPEVSGTWGSGRLLTGTAVSAVIAKDGRVAIGAVKPELLYQALER